jgi:Leucine-rich repeat (LRR) protein
VLKVLDVSKNDLKSFPPEIASLTQIKTFICSQCDLQRTIDISHVQTLTKIELDGNNLEETTLRPLPITLVRVNLSHNHFTSLTNSIIRDLVNLTELDLSFNRLETTEGLGTLVKVNILLLDNNLICELSEDLAGLISLRRISLKNNRIGRKSVRQPDKYSIPESFLTNSSVEKIDLSGNTNLRNADLLQFDGMDVFLERRNKAAEKQFSTGAMVSFSVFGLDG